MVQLGQEPTDAEVESIMTTADTNGNNWLRHSQSEREREREGGREEGGRERER